MMGTRQFVCSKRTKKTNHNCGQYRMGFLGPKQIRWCRQRQSQTLSHQIIRLVSRLCNRVVQLFQAVQQKFKASPLWSNQQNQHFRCLFGQLEKATLAVDLHKFKQAVVTFSRNKIAKQVSFLTTIKQKIQDFDLVDYRKIYKPVKKQQPKSQSTISPPKHISPQRLRKSSPSKEEKEKKQQKVRQARLALQQKQKVKRAKMQFINKIIMKNYSMMDLCRQNLLQNLMTEGEEEKVKLGERLMVRNQENAMLIHNYSMKSMAEREAKIAIQMSKFRERVQRQRERQQQRLLKARLAQQQKRKRLQKQFQKSLVISNQQKPKQPKKSQRYSLEKVVQRIPDLNFSFNKDRGLSLNQQVNQFKTVNMSAGAQMQLKADDQRKLRIQCMRRTQIFAKDKRKESSSPIQRWLNRESFKISSVLLNNHQQVQKVNVTENERLDIRYYQNNDKRLGDLRTRLKFKENRLYIE